MLIGCLIFFPLLAAPALFLLGRRRDRTLEPCAAACAGLETLLSLGLLLVLLRQSGPAPGPAPRLEIPVALGGALRFLPDGFGAVYGFLASLLWLGTALFSREYFRHEREHLASYWCFMFVTLGAVQGVFLSDNYLCAFVFFEILSLSSFPWVMQERTREALRAGKTYLAVAVIGGLVLFMGLLLLADGAGTLQFSALPCKTAEADPARLRAAGICILLGFGAKAGMFPLHIWLPKAHPVAPAPASALLSGMLTKIGVFGILMCVLRVLPEDRFFGLLVLILGLVTMVLGAVLALCSRNLKRTLACSSMSQIGFILTGLGAMVLCRAAGETEGAALACTGAMLHMANHSLLKLALFLSAGAVAMNLHALDLNDIRGWGRNKPLLRLVFAAAALGISGVPLFNGYLSKTLLHEGLVEAVAGEGWLLRSTEWVFLCSGGCTFAYMLKLYFCLFHEKNADSARQAEFDRGGPYLSPLSAGVLIVSALLVLSLGVPWLSLRLGALMTGEALGHFVPLSLENLKGSAISLSIGAVLYFGLVRTLVRRRGAYRDPWPAKLDLEDAVYRPLLLRWLPGILSPLARLFGENLLLRPLCRGLVFLGTLLGRTLESSLDFLVLLSRRTVLREEKLRDGRSRSRSRLRAFAQATELAFSNVLDNFSFAMMMTCVGVVLILAILIVLLL